MTKKNIIIAVVLIIIAVVGRLVPHAWNFTPLVAVSLFAGTYLGLRYAMTIPLVSMILGDIFIGIYDIKVMFVVYGSFLLAGIIGIYISKKISVTRILLSSLSASILFFVATNTAVWLWSGMYEPTFSGLTSSLIAGIAFFRNMMVGDLWFSFVLFGSYECAKLVLQRKFLIRAKVCNQEKSI